MKKNKKFVLPAIAFIAVVAFLGAVFLFTRPQGNTGNKTFTLEVILADGTSTSRNVSTDMEFLGAALLEQELISGDEGPYGLFMTAVTGIPANASKQEWWCLTKGGETVLYGIDQVPVEDGAHYELTLMVGW